MVPAPLPCTTVSAGPPSTTASSRCAHAARSSCTARPVGRCRYFDVDRLASGGSLFLTRPTLSNYLAERDELLRRAGDLFGLVISNRLTVRIGGTYPLADAARAHEDLMSRRTTGKLLLLPR